MHLPRLTFGLFFALTFFLQLGCCEQANSQDFRGQRPLSQGVTEPLQCSYVGRPSDPCKIQIHGPDTFIKKANQLDPTREYFGFGRAGLTIDWGDGTSWPKRREVIATSNDPDSITTHTYTVPGSYTVKARMFHPGPTDGAVVDWQGECTVVVEKGVDRGMPKVELKSPTRNDVYSYQEFPSIKFLLQTDRSVNLHFQLLDSNDKVVGADILKTISYNAAEQQYTMRPRSFKEYEKSLLSGNRKFKVKLTVADDAENEYSTFQSEPFTMTNVYKSNNLKLLPLGADMNSLKTTVSYSTFHSQDSSYILDWGDGSPPTQQVNPRPERGARLNGKELVFSHTYPKRGKYTVTMRSNDGRVFEDLSTVPYVEELVVTVPSVAANVDTKANKGKHKENSKSDKLTLLDAFDKPKRSSGLDGILRSLNVLAISFSIEPHQFGYSEYSVVAPFNGYGSTGDPIEITPYRSYRQFTGGPNFESMFALDSTGALFKIDMADKSSVEVSMRNITFVDALQNKTNYPPKLRFSSIAYDGKRNRLLMLGTYRFQKNMLFSYNPSEQTLSELPDFASSDAKALCYDRVNDRMYVIVPDGPEPCIRSLEPDGKLIATCSLRTPIETSADRHQHGLQVFISGDKLIVFAPHIGDPQSPAAKPSQVYVYDIRSGELNFKGRQRGVMI